MKIEFEGSKNGDQKEGLGGCYLAFWLYLEIQYMVFHPNFQY